MDQLLLKGFILKDVSQTTDMEFILFQMKDIVRKRALIAYEKLVKWQVERIVDEIALNQIRRPEQCSILDMAIKEVQRRIVYAEKRMQCTEFNLYIGIQMLIGRLNNKPIIYLKMTCPNDIYSKQLKTIPELVPYDIYESDLSDKHSEKKDFWEMLMEKYSSTTPLTATLINYGELAIDPEKLSYCIPEERAKEIAKEKILNQLLAAYACDQEIPPNKLMEYTLHSMERLNYKDIKNMIEHEQEVLNQILPVIDTDLVTRIGMPKQKKECPST